MKRSSGLSVIIPAAGIGYRMKSYGSKSLVQLSDDQCLISHQLSVINDVYPKAEIIVVVGFGSEKVMRLLPPEVKVVENELYAETGVVRSLGMGLRVASHLKSLIIYGDIVFNHAAIDCFTGRTSVCVLDSSGQITDDEIGVNTIGGKVSAFGYGLPNKWAQIVYLKGGELELLKRAAWLPSSRRMLGHEALNAVIEGGGVIKTTEPENMRLKEVDFVVDARDLKNDHSF